MENWALIIVSATRQKNVRQKNEECVWSSSFFCLTFFCLVGFGGRNDDRSRKIAYELRERALYYDELVMPLSQFIAGFGLTPALGKLKAQAALDYVRAYPLDPASREKFEERFGYFSRKEAFVSQAQLAEREKDKTLCVQCGKKMTMSFNGRFVQLRCETCDITRFEKSEDVI